jgi:hypothetical protein
MQELEITIDRNGNATVKVTGIKGAGCEALTRKIEGRTGIVTERVHTGEYYENTSEILITDTIQQR